MTDDQPPPAPPRRDHESPAARHHGPRLTPELRALRDAWLDELWPVCREVPREQREIDRAIATENTHRRGPGQAA